MLKHVTSFVVASVPQLPGDVNARRVLVKWSDGSAEELGGNPVQMQLLVRYLLDVPISRLPVGYDMVTEPQVVEPPPRKVVYPAETSEEKRLVNESESVPRFEGAEREELEKAPVAKKKAKKRSGLPKR